MMLPKSPTLPIFLLLLLDNVSGTLLPRAEKTPKARDPHCTVTNPVTKEFFDLRPLIRKASDKCF
jgi:hypothetical protein